MLSLDKLLKKTIMALEWTIVTKPSCPCKQHMLAMCPDENGDTTENVRLKNEKLQMVKQFGMPCLTDATRILQINLPLIDYAPRVRIVSASITKRWLKGNIPNTTGRVNDPMLSFDCRLKRPRGETTTWYFRPVQQRDMRVNIGECLFTLITKLLVHLWDSILVAATVLEHKSKADRLNNKENRKAMVIRGRGRGHTSSALRCVLSSLISKEDAERIQIMQNTAIRFVYGLCRRDHVSPFRDAAGLMTMDAVCRMQTCCLINNVLFQREPRYLAEKLCVLQLKKHLFSLE
ncbi:hypothetical protein J6590_026094 [Homalodisca vitripennis]|nr:hypothetical protein J6590_026094 [Homalodisca vitripennis]